MTPWAVRCCTVDKTCPCCAALNPVNNQYVEHNRSKGDGNVAWRTSQSKFEIVLPDSCSLLTQILILVRLFIDGILFGYYGKYHVMRTHHQRTWDLAQDPTLPNFPVLPKTVPGLLVCCLRANSDSPSARTRQVSNVEDDDIITSP